MLNNIQLPYQVTIHDRATFKPSKVDVDLPRDLVSQIGHAANKIVGYAVEDIITSEKFDAVDIIVVDYKNKRYQVSIKEIK